MNTMALGSYYFNSIKVRLKRGAAIGAGAGLLFQFHKGTIKTFLFRLCLPRFYISIP